MDTETNKQKCQSDEPPPKYGIDSLPQETVIDIASRLPITSLVQFKFVRKSFYNLSHDLELVNLHLSRAVKNDPCIIFHTYDNQHYFVELSDLGREEEVAWKISTPFVLCAPEIFKVVGSCQGLFCISNCLYGNALYVYNPFTRDYKELPIPIERMKGILIFGFGFSHVTKEYKVIKITYNNEPCLFLNCTSEVEVFSLSGNSWRSIGEAAYRIDPFTSQGIMFNGKMHWLTRFEKYNGRWDRLIVSFDLADEVFAEVPKFYFNVDQNMGKFHLAVLGSCLAVAITLPDHNGGGTEIWVMREYNVKESWVLEFIIGAYTPIPKLFTDHSVKVLCLLKNGELLLHYKGGNMVLYDPQNGVFRDLKFQGISSFFHTTVHVGCLCWIDIPPKDL